MLDALAIGVPFALAIGVPLALAIAAAAIDLRTREIPDAFPIAIAAVGFLAATFRWQPVSVGGALAGLAIGVVVGVLFFASRGFGGGDAKLIAAIGATVGPLGLAWVLLFMALAGGGLAIVAKRRRQTSIAYGPAIAIGLLAYDACKLAK